MINFKKIFIFCIPIAIHAMDLNEFLEKERKLNSAIDNELIDAIRSKDIKKVQNAIERGANVNCIAGRNAHYNSAGLLHLAILYNNFEGLKLLVDNKAHLGDRNSRNQTPLIYAVDSKSPEMVKLLIEAGSNIESVDKDGCTALNVAAYNGSTEIADLLIKAKANLNATDIFDKSILEWSADEGHLDVTKMLIEAGVEKETNKKNNALFYSITRRHDHVIKFLLINGFLLNNEDLLSHFEACKFLDRNKLSLDALKFTPIFWAAAFEDNNMLSKYLDDCENLSPASMSENLVDFAKKRCSESIISVICIRLENLEDLIHKQTKFAKPLCKLIREYLYNY